MNQIIVALIFAGGLFVGMILLVSFFFWVHYFFSSIVCHSYCLNGYFPTLGSKFYSVS